MPVLERAEIKILTEQIETGKQDISKISSFTAVVRRTVHGFVAKSEINTFKAVLNSLNAFSVQMFFSKNYLVGQFVYEHKDCRWVHNVCIL